MNKQETEDFLTKLTPLVFCKFCEKNIKRQDIGYHYRTKLHKENLERCRTEGTYEDLIEYCDLYMLVQKFIIDEKKRKNEK